MKQATWQERQTACWAAISEAEKVALESGCPIEGLTTHPLVLTAYAALDANSATYDGVDERIYQPVPDRHDDLA